jgi:hypothetical protein
MAWKWEKLIVRTSPQKLMKIVEPDSLLQILHFRKVDAKTLNKSSPTESIQEG